MAKKQSVARMARFVAEGRVMWASDKARLSNSKTSHNALITVNGSQLWINAPLNYDVVAYAKSLVGRDIKEPVSRGNNGQYSMFVGNRAIKEVENPVYDYGILNEIEQFVNA